MLHSAFIRFHQLPNDLKRAVTSPQAMQQLDAIETKYRIPLAEVIVQLMVKEVPLQTLPSFFEKTHALPSDKAASLAQELQTTVLKPVLPYLSGIGAQPTPVRTATPPAATMGNVATPSAVPTPVPARPTTMRPVVPTPPLQRPKLPSQQYSKVASGKAAYYVFAEDEEEIAKHRDRLDRLGGASPTAQVADRVEGIITKFRLTFADDILAKRFRGLLLSRLRDVRSSDELKELLMRSSKIGGMGYEEAQATSIATEADAIARTLHDRDAAGHLAEPQKKPVLPEAKPQVPPPPVHVPVPPVPPPPPPKPPVLPPKPPVAKPVPPSVQIPPLTPLRRSVVVPQVGRRVIQDIRRPQRPVSLVEELGMLTLDDFRQLGGNLEECVAKVIEKVQLLSEESYERRAEGIAAWRKSEVHQLYLAMGRESMLGNKTIEEIMSERRRQQLPYLTATEFTAIADLNHQLIP